MTRNKRKKKKIWDQAPKKNNSNFNEQQNILALSSLPKENLFYGPVTKLQKAKQKRICEMAK